MLELHRVDGQTVSRSIGLAIDLPVVAMVAAEDGEIIAGWGLAWNGGRCWLWFHTEVIDRRFSYVVLREARKMIARAWQLGETEIYAVRDASYASSLKLMKILGFVPISIEGEQEIWRFWRHCPD